MIKKLFTIFALISISTFIKNINLIASQRIASIVFLDNGTVLDMDHHMQLRRSLVPLGILSRFYGVSPVTITKEARVKLSAFGILQGCCTWIGIGVLCVWVQVLYPKHINQVLKITISSYYIVMSACCFLHVLRARVISSTIKQIFKLTDASFDKNIFHVLNFINFACQFTIVGIYISLYFGNVSFFGGITIKIVHHFAEWYSISAMSVINFQHAYTVMFASQMFVLINKKIKSLLINQDFIVLVRQYGKLCDLCGLISRGFGVISLGYAIHTLCSLVFCLFYLYHFFGKKFLLVFVYVVSTVLLVGNQWMVLFAWERLLKQVSLN